MVCKLLFISDLRPTALPRVASRWYSGTCDPCDVGIKKPRQKAGLSGLVIQPKLNVQQPMQSI